MSSDLDIAQKEEEFRENQARNMAREAAEMVLEGVSRHAAIQAVKDRYRELEDASENELIRDDDGFATHIDDIPDQKPPSLDKKKQAQLKVVAEALLPEFE